MEREKMIDEMSDKIEQSFLEESRKDENKTYPWQELPVFRSVCKKIASSLVSQNVRIIPEGAVVLTKEKLIELNEKGFTFDTTTGGKINLIEMAREIERKEATRIFEELYKYATADYIDGFINNSYKSYDWGDLIKNKASDFGVEVEE